MCLCSQSNTIFLPKLYYFNFLIENLSENSWDPHPLYEKGLIGRWPVTVLTRTLIIGYWRRSITDSLRPTGERPSMVSDDNKTRTVHPVSQDLGGELTVNNNKTSTVLPVSHDLRGELTANNN